MNSINPIGPMQGPSGSDISKKIDSQNKDVPSFKDTLNGFLSDVNEMQQKASESIQKMVAGEINDVHQVMATAEEANVAFNMMMEIRNKVLEAYQEIMRIRL